MEVLTYHRISKLSSKTEQNSIGTLYGFHSFIQPFTFLVNWIENKYTFDQSMLQR